jgi:hypothetical protein
MALINRVCANLLGTLLLCQALGKTIADGPLRRGQEEIFQSVLKKFKALNQLKDGYDIEQNMQEIETTASSFSLAGKSISLESQDLIAVADIFAQDASFYMDGEQQPNLPARAVFRSKNHPDVKVIKTDEIILGAYVKDLDTGTHIDLIPVVPDSNTFVTVTAKDVDEEKLSKFLFADPESGIRRERVLQIADEGYNNKEHGRSLQACSSFQEIQVASKY